MPKKEEKPINNIWGYLFVAFLLWLGISIATDVPVAGDIVAAEIVGVHQVQSEVPTAPMLLVKLESGITVPVSAPKSVLRRVGEKVRLQKFERELFGTVTFRFIGFIEE